ncbi:coiled-coil domain-containing protein 112-like [Melitaea cinxia]|uniref:coiled-coil domain-containing protein 112-like n=1 Tax=Melitaea cinxia TaxID=113334 RepID=UPI001E274D41|nr:coiled-coil domain-containing protein 112-like [Melitaea cinxia]
MSKTNNSRTSSELVSTNDSDYVARLRRLKIQEGILVSNVNKKCEEHLEISDENNKYKKNVDLKKYLYQLKHSYTQMKNLYEDIKVKTNIHETSGSIDEIKNDILELEDKIKSFKQFLSKELQRKQVEESALLEKSNDNNLETKKCVVYPKNQTKKYKELVSSPVRVLIKSPFKCLEIHQFQEFMKSSPNRYGGWNEYKHSQFVQIWDKHNGDVVFTSKPIRDTRLLLDFKNEVLHKISVHYGSSYIGTKAEDVISHIEWYSQYIYLKMCQKKALDKWKENRRKIKKPLREGKSTGTINSALENTNVRKFPAINTSINGETFTNVESDVIDIQRKLDVRRLMRPTKQWIRRCEKDKKIDTFGSNIDNFSKLCVPAWRLNTEFS